MLSLSHTLISLPLGVYFQNPVLIFLAAFITHLACDAVIHWNIFPHHYRRFPYSLIALDVLAGPLIAYLFLGQHLFTAPIMAAILGGNAPDVLHTTWIILRQHGHARYLNWLNPFFYWHHRWQVETTHLGLGLIPQLLMIAFSLVLVLTRAG